MDILNHDFNLIGIGQLTEDTQFGKKLVPKGYVNLTAMCQAEGKQLKHWKEIDRTKAYLKALSLDAGITTSRLLVRLSGAPNGNAALQGTWGHPEVAIDLATWISPKFQVWANRTLRLVVAGEFTPNTANAAIAQSQLKQEYSNILDRPDPWKKLFEPEFCREVYKLGGPHFFWDFCYPWLTPIERCEIELLNPVVNGQRKQRIHQFFRDETKQRLAPYLAELAAIVATADGDKQAFWFQSLIGF
jgi:KilA-N domain